MPVIARRKPGTGSTRQAGACRTTRWRRRAHPPSRLRRDTAPRATGWPSSVRLEILEQELAVDEHEGEHQQADEDGDRADQISRERAPALHCRVLMEGCCSSPSGG